MVRGFRFGVFDLDASTGELRKHGMRVRLARQSVEILRLMVDRPGELVSRDEIRHRLWPGGEVVEYEHSINTAVARLREALGESASAPRVFETIPRLGYRLLVPVEIIEEADARSAEVPPAAQPAPAPPDLVSPVLPPASPPPILQPSTRVHQRRRALTVGGTIAAALALAILAAWRLAVSGPGESDTVRSIVVLPFLDLSGPTSQEQMADWMTERLIAELGSLNRFRVTSHTTARSYKGVNKPVRDIGRELGADAVLEGSVQVAGSTVRTTARLIDARSDQQLWSASFERPAGEVMAVQAGIARAIVTGLRIAVTPTEMAAVPRRVKPEALEAYLKGRYAFDLGGAGDFGVGHIRDAVRLDPEFALGWATLGARALSARIADDQPVSEEVLVAARKALELDDRLAEAHVVAGDIEFFANWNWARGEAEYRRAVELNPSSAEAQLHFGIAMFALGRVEPALEALRRTTELSPRAPIVNGGYGHALRQAGRTTEALQQIRRSIDIAPNVAQNYLFLARVHEDMGQDEAALEAMSRAATLSSVAAETIQARREVYRAEGLAGMKRRIGEERLKVLRARAAHTRVSPVAFAQAYSEAGDKAEAFKWLEKAFEAKSLRLPWLPIDAAYDPLRAEPEYAALLARMGLR